MVQASIIASRSVFGTSRAGLTAARLYDRNVIVRFDAVREYGQQYRAHLRAHRTMIQRQLAAVVASRLYDRNVKAGLQAAREYLQLQRASVTARRWQDYPQGYDVYAIDVSDLAETYLGFISVEAEPKQLTGLSLPDGEYEIEIRLRGALWDDVRVADRFPVTIGSGAPTALTLPRVDNLAGTQTGASVRLTWSWRAGLGIEAPYEFAIWTDTGGAPDTSGEPDITQRADLPRLYSQVVDQGTDPLYVAVAARDQDGNKGQVSSASFTVPLTDPEGPAGQFIEPQDRVARDFPS